MRTLILPMLLGAALLPGQSSESPSAEVTAAAKARLKTSLQQTADKAGTAFHAKWGADGKQGNDPLRAFLRNQASGDVNGAWFADHQRLRYKGDKGDELLIKGSHMIARDGKHGWCRRRVHFADGNKLSFAPNPQLLLRQLGDWDLAVTQRSVGSLDDRPVEILSVTLSAEQVGELIWSEALPAALTTAEAMVFRVAAGMAGNQRQAATPPDTTVDLAIAIDPSTNIVHEIRVRAWNEAGRGVGGAFVLVGGRAVQRAGNDEEDEEHEEAEPDGPLRYEHGLPKRPRKKMSVMDYRLRLSEQGERPPQTLTDEQQRLLR